MRILFSCRPAYGHVYPLVPLALAARAVGHDVVFATGDPFVQRLAALGFGARPVGISVGTAEAEARRAIAAEDGTDSAEGAEDQVRVLVSMFAEILPRRTLADLLPVLEELRPDLVVYEQSDVGAAGAALRAGIPFVSHVIGRAMPAALRELAKPAFDWLWQGAIPGDPMLGDTCLDLWPPGLADPGTAVLPHRLPLRPVPWNPPAPLPTVVARRSARPLVYLTLGTVAFGAAEVLRTAVEGLARLDVDVLVAVGPGDPALLGSVPDRIQIERFVPQAEILGRVDAVVHHGGTGTLLGALGQGRPQLLLPQGADQFVNAEAISAHGAGLQLLEPTPELVAESVGKLLEDTGHRDAARTLQAEIAALPAPAEVVPQLAELG